MTIEIDLAFNPQRLIEDLKKQIDASLTQRDVEALGAYAKRLIIARTRNGFGVAGNGQSAKRLEKLKNSTKKSRSRFRSNSQFFSPNKSNLTLTGRMLNRLRTNVSGTRGNWEFVIEGADQFTRDKISFAHEGSANREKREFLFLSKSEIAKLRARFKEIVRSKF